VKVKTICIRQVVEIFGKVSDKHNDIQPQLITDIAERIRNNLATPTAKGEIILLYSGAVQKTLYIEPANVTVESIENGKSVVIQVTDTSTDEYNIDQLQLFSAVSGYDGSGSSALYSIYTLTTPIAKPSDQALAIKWEIQFVKGGST